MKVLLKKIIAEFLDSKDDSSHAFRRLYNIGVRGCEAFNLDLTGNLKTVVIDVNLNHTANLPQDYITYSKIGVLNNKGEVVTYKRNDQLSFFNDEYTNQEDRTTGAPVLNTLTPFFDQNTYPNDYYNYNANGTSYNLFGADSGTPKVGTYKVDVWNGLIVLDIHNPYTQVVLEYLSDGYDAQADDYEIDIQAKEAFICYLRWKNAQDLYKKFSQSDVRSFKLEYYREMRLAAMRINSFVLNEMEDISRRANKLAPKS